MPDFLTIILVCLLMGATPAQAAEKQEQTKPAELRPEDRKVVAVMEILQLMDLTEEMDILKDMNYLIEEDQNGPQTD